MPYTIGEMAKKMGVAPSTLRYYEKEGLLPFVTRSGSGNRVFHDSDLERLSIIECLKQTGLPIKGIKAFMGWCLEGDSTIGKRLELMQNQRQAVLDQIEQLKETLEVLDYKVWYYETAKKAGTCDAPDSVPVGELPENLRTAKLKIQGHFPEPEEGRDGCGDSCEDARTA